MSEKISSTGKGTGVTWALQGTVSLSLLFLFLSSPFLSSLLPLTVVVGYSSYCSLSKSRSSGAASSDSNSAFHSRLEIGLRCRRGTLGCSQAFGEFFRIHPIGIVQLHAAHLCLDEPVRRKLSWCHSSACRCVCEHATQRPLRLFASTHPSETPFFTARKNPVGMIAPAVGMTASYRPSYRRSVGTAGPVVMTISLP
jgi:hypothetical protein